MNYIRLTIFVFAFCATMSGAHAAKPGEPADPSDPSDMSTPTTNDIRSFSARLTSEGPFNAVFIPFPSEQPGFVVTDIFLTGFSGTSNMLSVRLASTSNNDLAVFDVFLDEMGRGRREIHFESGIVARPVDDTAATSLSLQYIGGIGVVQAVVSGYYFTP